jgi:hypothetical protein
VRIDRLVLDIPGLDPAQGRALALRVAEGLAATGASGERAMVSVPLTAGGGGAPADLAAKIVAALLERLA